MEKLFEGDIERLNPPLFQPTKIQIFVGENADNNGTPSVWIRVVLTQTVAGGEVVSDTTKLYPVGFKNVITGMNPSTLQPILDLTTLGQILLQHNIELQ